MNPDLIFDLGMHRGGDTKFYLEKGYRVVAVEANPALVQRARDEFAPYLRSGRLFICPYAIAEEHGLRRFYINRLQDDWSSLVDSFGKRGDEYDEIQVPTMPLTSLVNIFGVPFYLKIDIEGLDAFCVDQLLSLPSLPAYISVEATVPQFAVRAHNAGYRRFKLVGQRRAASHTPERTVHGHSAIPAEAGLTSGHFGEEAYGRWLSFDEMLAEVVGLLDECWDETVQMREYGYSRDEFANEWWDFHAAL